MPKLDLSVLDEPEPAPPAPPPINLSIAQQELLALRALWFPMLPRTTTISVRHAKTGLTCKIRTHPNATKGGILHFEWIAMIALWEQGSATPLVFEGWLKTKISSKGEFRVQPKQSPDVHCKVSVGELLEAYGLEVLDLEVDSPEPQLR